MGQQPEFIDENSELVKQADVEYKLATRIRAPFLEQAIVIDRLIADIISQHFCPDEEKRTLFFSLITNGITLSFHASINVFEKLLKLCYPDLYEKHLFKKLDTIRNFRNRIAHSMLDTSEEFLAKGYTDRIRLVVHMDGKQKHQTITNKDINERLGKCTEVILALVNIQKEVIIRVSKNSV